MPQGVRQSQAMELVDDADRITIDEKQLIRLLKDQPNQAFMIAPDAAGLWYNQAFYDYTGRTPEYMKNWAWQDFVPVEEIPRVAGSLYQALATGQPWECVQPLFGRKGVCRQFLMKAAPVYGPSGKIKLWVGGAMDITDYVGPARARGDLRR